MTRPDLVAAALLSVVGPASLRAAVLLGLTALATFAARRASAATIHFVWAAALAASLAAIVLPFALPAWRVIPAPVPVVIGLTSRPIAVAFDVVTEPQAIAGAAELVRLPQALSRRPASSRPAVVSGPMLVAGLWALGCLAMAIRFTRSRRALGRLARRSTPLEATAVADRIAAIAAESPVGRPVRFLVSDDVDVALTWGVRRPTVMIPAEAVEWDPARCEHVVRHELAHVGRWDAAIQLMAQAASALFWFHPLVWYACRELRRTRERACDDHVLAAGASRVDYADDLLAMVRNDGPLRRVSLAIARRSEFEGRLLALLDPGGRHGLLSGRVAAAISAATLACLIPVATIGAAPARPAPASFVAPSATPTMSASAPSLAVSAARPRRPQLPVVAAPADDLLASCGQATDSHEHQNGDGPTTTWTVSVGDDRCRLTLDALGQIRFNDHGTALTGISADGHFALAIAIGASLTRVEALPSADGLRYTFTRDGATQPFDAAAEAWMASALLALDRVTGFAIDARWPALERAGVPATLDEVARMRTAHAAFLYLNRLVATASLDDATLRRLVALVATDPFWRASTSLLRRLASRYELSAATLAPMLTLAGRAIRDEDRAQVLLALPARSLEPASRAEALAIAASIKDNRLRTRTVAALARDGRGTGR